MTATNHAITGAIIGLLVGEPLVAIPAAFLSHFVCDTIPHFGDEDNKDWIKTTTFKRVLTVDAILCIILVAVIVGLKPEHWLLACICAFVATSPDLVWINVFVKTHLGKKWQPSLFSKFASVIQWFQRPIGVVVEATWAIAGIIVLSTIMH